MRRRGQVEEPEGQPTSGETQFHCLNRVEKREEPLAKKNGKACPRRLKQLKQTEPDVV
jgi:hypothetical protein